MSRQNPRIPLNWFDNNRCHFISRHIELKSFFYRSGTFSLCDFIAYIRTEKRKMINFRHKWPHLRMHTWSACRHCAGTVGISMISVNESNNLRAASIGTGKLHRRVITI